MGELEQIQSLATREEGVMLVSHQAVMFSIHQGASLLSVVVFSWALLSLRYQPCAVSGSHVGWLSRLLDV